MDREVDLRVDYIKRENLPDEVRPKVKGGQTGGPINHHTMSASMFTFGNESAAANGPVRPDLSEFD